MSVDKIFDQVFDLCIIGAGPAGIILALEYAKLDAAAKVVLIEYGTTGTEKNALDDSIVIRNPTNHYDPYECTNKGLGGTSATWGGRCVMYDTIDFLARPILRGGCTWGMDILGSLKKHLSRTADYFECGDAEFNLESVSDNKYRPIAERFVQGDVLDSPIERWSMPTRFGKRYRNEIANQANLLLLEGYEARNFSAPEENGRVSSLTIRLVSSGHEASLRSKRFVISAGTQESTRILLRNKALFNRLPSPPPALGKYYQGHLSGKIASVKFYGDPEKTDYGFIVDKDGIFLRRRFQFSDDFLQRNNLLNTAIWLDNPLYYDPVHKSGPMSFMYLAMITPILGKKLAPPAIARSVTKGKVFGIPQHIGNILRGFPNSVITPVSIFHKRYLLKRKLPGIFLYSPTNEYALHFHSEQIPNYSSEMKLGNDGETLIIDYKVLDDDISSVIRLHQELDQWLRKCNCGELNYWFSEKDLPASIRQMTRDGIHQSGTTRIGKSPETGVVDSDLKVHGTENVYVCSSSVFPTSSQANPTFLTGVFAVRLAEHLKNQK